MVKVFLTDKTVKSLKPAAKGTRYDVMDEAVPGFGVRVTDNGAKTFVLVTRYPVPNSLAKNHPSRRALGEYRNDEGDTGSLALARQKAKEWRALVKKGIDPREQLKTEQAAAEKEIADVQAAEISARRGVFSAVAEAFLARDDFKKQRRSAQVEREIRRELLDVSRNPWAERLVSQIDDADIAAVIASIRDRPAPYQAYNVLGHCRAIFTWAKRPENRKKFGLLSSPLDDRQPKDFGLKKDPRQRVLTNLEIAAFWRAAGKMGYPNGTMFQLLLVTGQRKSEIAEASWQEVDIPAKLLIVPPERFKSDANHMVPLSNLAWRIISALPQCSGDDCGDFLFSTRNGKIPVNGFSNAKEELDRRMLVALRAYARMHNADPKNVRLEHFVIHDVRRTVRTRLSSLKVEEPVAELVIGHAKKGLSRIYNQYKYLDEMREALNKWADLLLSIVTTPDVETKTAAHN